jgi:hypothetical protein
VRRSPHLVERTNRFSMTQVKALTNLASIDGAIMGTDSLKAKDTAAVVKIAMK